MIQIFFYDVFHIKILMKIFLFQVLGSDSEFHFTHRALPHARTRRSVPHMRLLKKDPEVLFPLCSKNYVC